MSPFGRDRQAARGVEPGFQRRTVLARVALLAADDRTDGRFPQHERAGPERDDHQHEDERAAQAVGAQQGWRDERRAGRGGRHRDHAVADRHPGDAPPHDGRGLRRTPEDADNRRDRERRNHRTRDPPVPHRSCRGPVQQSRARCRAGQQRAADPERRDDAEGGRPEMGADADERLAAPVFLDERACVEPGPAADEDADVAVVRPPLVDLDRTYRARAGAAIRSAR